MKFCVACTRVLETFNKKRIASVDDDKRLYHEELFRGFEHHRSGQDFLRAVEEGCAFCQSLGLNVVEYRQRESLENPEVGLGRVLSGILGSYDTISTRAYLEESRKTISFHCLGNDGTVLENAGFDVLLARALIWEGGERHPSTASCRGDLECQNLARYWLDQCSLHTQCSQHRRGYCPKSLVEILDSAYPSSRVRLIHSSPWRAAPLYATLSYCCGDVPAMDLTRARLTEFERGIDADLLPLTYRHAFAICAALSIRYLWIDSLCIIQDDAQDWLKEAQQMSEIFKNSYLTIAADASNNRQGGLFVECTASEIPRIKTKLPPATHGLFGDAEVDFIDHKAFRIIASQSLNRRGWVLQERVLSRRILHFTTHGLMWECASYRATQMFQQGVPNIERLDNVRDLDVFATREDDAAHGCLSPARHKAWVDLVVLYTSAALTYPDDRPLAIQGIADEISRISGMQYVAGLWHDNLIAQLIWYEYYRGHPWKYRNASRRSMPSFSWLSIDGPVVVKDASLFGSPVSRIIAVQSGPLETTPNGLVQQASLEIRTTLRRLNFMREPKTDGWTVEWQSDEFPRSHFAWEWRLDHSRPGFSISSMWPAEYFVILLMRHKLSWYGLLLVAQDLQKKEFRRIGCFQFDGDIQHIREEFEEWMARSTEETVIKLV